LNSEDKIHKLLGKVIEVEKTGETRKDDEGNVWEKCIFTVELARFSRRTEERIPETLKGKKVNLERWCCFGWHYKLGAHKTLEADETEAVMLHCVS
jgi:hypothetical protein